MNSASWVLNAPRTAQDIEQATTGAKEKDCAKATVPTVPASTKALPLLWQVIKV